LQGLLANTQMGQDICKIHDIVEQVNLEGNLCVAAKMNVIYIQWKQNGLNVIGKNIYRTVTLIRIRKRMRCIYYFIIAIMKIKCF